ncbi:hypothetical protein BaRGS_00000560 [Batillaria attramentaria]|uniref:Uncharacterized protein n=1 Tax=Batillaria attramentaria TaxID=370345 RepID=A0ABD0MAW4_9CAEN
MASSATRARMFLTKFQLKMPEKWKGGRLERIARYFQNIANDYKAAVLEMAEDMKASPRKSAFYLAVLGTGALLAKTNPSEVSFRATVTENAQDLMMLGDPIRNYKSDRYVQRLQEAYLEGTLRYTNCGLFSLIWIAGFDPAVSKYEARCKQVKPRWTEFHKQVVDIGVLGRWRMIHRAMQDYDINPDEWDEEGRKRPIKASVEQ